MDYFCCCGIEICYIQKYFLIEKFKNFDKCIKCLIEENNDLENEYIMYLKDNIEDDEIDYFLEEVNIYKEINFEKRYYELLEESKINLEIRRYLSQINNNNYETNIIDNYNLSYYNKKNKTDYHSEIMIEDIKQNSIVYKEKNIQTDCTQIFPNVKLNKKRKYIPRRLSKNDTNIINVNSWYKWIDFSKYTIGTTIIAQKKGWDSKTIIIGNFCKNCREVTNTSDDYCINCYHDMTGQSDRPGIGIYNGKYNRCDNCCNLFLFTKKDDKYCDKCILDYCENCYILEEENNKKETIKEKLKRVKKGTIFTFNGKKLIFKGIVYKHTKEIESIKNEIKNLRNDINIYKNNIKKNLDYIEKIKINYIFLDKNYNEDYFKKRKEEINKNHEDFNIFLNNKQKERKDFTNNFNKIYDEAVKELDKLISLENIYIKLTSNNTNMDIFNVFNKDFPLYNNIEELKKNKVEKYKKISELGYILYNNKLKKEDLKKINSINSKSRPARYIQKYKRIYLLEKYLDIEKIALSNIGNWIRDKSDNMFNSLLYMLQNKYLLTNI